MSGPSIQGSIIIRTDSVSQAIKHVQDLKGRMEGFSQSATGGMKGVSDAIDRQAKSFGVLAQQTAKMTTEQARNEALLAKAANRYAQFEAAVKKSGVSQQAQVDLLQRAAGQLKGYEQALGQVATGGAKLSNINTELSVSYSQLQRDLGATSNAAKQEARAKAEAQKASEANLNTLSRTNMQYDQVRAAISRANLGTEQETVVVRQVEQAHRQLQSVLKSGTATRQQVSAAQRNFNETMGRAKITAQTGQMKSAAAATNQWQSEMRNLSTSVVVALGPLSGVASRLTALTTLFNRNAASIAGVLAAVTGLSVLMSRSMQVSREAEQQMFRLDAQIQNLGKSSQVTGAELEYMAHAVAAATMTSAKEARQASGVLLEFGGIARNQFQGVLLAAQGMSAVFGGTLSQNARRLGRAIEDPVGGMTRLEQQGVILDESVKEHIKTLVTQGKQYEATSVLLENLTSLQKAGQQETKGLAGAYDTLSGNLDVLFQELFMGSGAIQAATDNMHDLSQAVSDFTNSDMAKAIGAIFKAVLELGGSGLNYLIKNLDSVAMIMVAMTASVIPKLLLVMGKMFASLMANSAAAWSTTKAMFGLAGASKSATISVRAFTAALLANPITAIGFAIAGVVASVISYRNAIDSLQGSTPIGDRIESQIDAVIRANQNLTREMADMYGDQGKQAVDAVKAEEDALEQRKNNFSSALDELRSEMGMVNRMSARLSGGLENVVTMNALSNGRAYADIFKDLSDEQRIYLQRAVEASLQTREQSKALDQARKSAEQLEEVIRNDEGTETRTAALARMEAQVKQIAGWEEEVFPDIKKMRELEKMEQTFLDSASALRELSSEGIEVSDELAKVEKLLAEIRRQKEEVNAVEISRDAKRFAEQAREAAIELAKMQEIFAAGGDEGGLIEMQYQIDAVAASLQELSDQDLQYIRDSLPQVGDAAGPRAIAEAFVQMQRDADGLSDSLERNKRAQEELQTQFAAIKNELDPAGAAMDEFNRKMQVLVSMWQQADSTEVREEIALLQAQLAAAFGETLGEGGDGDAFDWSGYASTVDSIANYTTNSFTEMSANLGMLLEDMGVGITDSLAKTAIQAAGVMDGMMGLMESTNREGSKMYQAFAIAQATMAGGIAITKALAEGGPILGPVMAAITAANVGAQIASIKAAKYATGGYVSGPGSGTSDSIPARLSNGEYVMRASAVKALGIDTLDAMNAGKATPFSMGGIVGVPTGVSTGNGGGNMNVQIIDQTKGNHEYETTEEVDANGERNIRVLIRDTVKDLVGRGDLDNDIGGRFDVRPRGRRV